MWTLIKCPHCGRIIKKEGHFVRGTKAYMVDCIHCKRRFHLWEARIMRREGLQFIDITDTERISRGMLSIQSKYERYRQIA